MENDTTNIEEKQGLTVSSKDLLIKQPLTVYEKEKLVPLTPDNLENYISEDYVVKSGIRFAIDDSAFIAELNQRINILAKNTFDSSKYTQQQKLDCETYINIIKKGIKKLEYIKLTFKHLGFSYDKINLNPSNLDCYKKFIQKVILNDKFTSLTVTDLNNGSSLEDIIDFIIESAVLQNYENFYDETIDLIKTFDKEQIMNFNLERKNIFNKIQTGVIPIIKMGILEKLYLFISEQKNIYNFFNIKSVIDNFNSDTLGSGAKALDQKTLIEIKEKVLKPFQGSSKLPEYNKVVDDVINGKNHIKETDSNVVEMISLDTGMEALNDENVDKNSIEMKALYYSTFYVALKKLGIYNINNYKDFKKTLNKKDNTAT